jgi:biopolymer transport protein ExbD
MRRRVERRQSGDLILTSLVDIALCLILGFLVAMPLFFETGIFVSAPGVARASSGEQGTDVKANIFLTNDGRILLNESEVSVEQLSDLLPKLLDRSRERRVVVATDDQVVYDRVMRVLDLAKQSGAADLALLRKRRAP